MTDYGFKLSKPGYDIKTCAVKDQVINSERNSLKIWMAGSNNISVSEFTGFAGTGEGYFEVNHSLGYAPFFITFFKLKHSTKIWLQDSLDQSMLATNFIHGESYTDTTKLHAHIYVNGNNLAAWTGKVYYYILIDKAMI
ncbi:MAG: hypothetical protein WC346_04245 [Methanogenium sp.]|jgi:hypothetical protein